LKILGENTLVQEAPEPTNIIWEHLEIPLGVQEKRTWGVFAMIGVLIFCAFLLFTLLKATSGNNKLKYSDKINCNNIDNQFGLEYDEDDNLQENILYYTYAAFDRQPTLDQNGAGIYQCYCETFSSKRDAFDDASIC